MPNTASDRERHSVRSCFLTNKIGQSVFVGNVSDANPKRAGERNISYYVYDSQPMFPVEILPPRPTTLLVGRPVSTIELLPEKHGSKFVHLSL